MNAVFDMGNLGKLTSTDTTTSETPTPKSKNKKPQSISAREKLAWAEKQIAAAKAAQRKAERNKAAILGQAILAALTASPQDDDLKRRVSEIVRVHVKSKSDLAEVADLV